MVWDLIKGWLYLLLFLGLMATLIYLVELTAQSREQLPAPLPEIPNQQVGAVEDPSEVQVSTPPDPGPSASVPLPPAEETPETVLPPVTTVTEEQPSIKPAPPVENLGPLTLCRLSDNLDGDLNEPTFSDQGYLEMPAVSSGVSALFEGEVVRRFKSPYTGDTLFLLAANHQFVALYGGLRFNQELQEGFRLDCGESMGTTPRAPWFFGVFRLDPGQPWWQGELLDEEGLRELWSSLPPANPSPDQ